MGGWVLIVLTVSGGWSQTTASLDGCTRAATSQLRMTRPADLAEMYCMSMTGSEDKFYLVKGGKLFRLE